MISQVPQLKKLDSVLISKKERDNAKYLSAQVKKYPLPSIEQELWDTIQDHKNDRENNQDKEKD